MGVVRATDLPFLGKVHVRSGVSADLKDREELAKVKVKMRKAGAEPPHLMLFAVSCGK